MRFFCKAKDGGPASSVTGYWLVEIKSLFSIALLKFDGLGREAYHSHAFNSINWLLTGQLIEQQFCGDISVYRPSWRPIITPRRRFHRVGSPGRASWVLSLRGPWAKRWKEYDPTTHKYTVLFSGREIVERYDGP